MSDMLIAKPIKKPFFTPWVWTLCGIICVGMIFIAMRFIFGIGAISNIDHYYPWGVFKGFTVAAFVALSAGGFTTAALGHIFHRENYHIIIRPALLIAMFGYTFAGGSVFFDLGRFYYIFHPVYMWNANSALFEVGICVMIYLTVLYIEFIPVITERFLGKVNLKYGLAFLNGFVEKLLAFLDNSLSKSLFLFVIAGVVLSTLHQSSLGTLMVIAGTKIHPLWQTPVLPILFLISAICVGFPIVIFENLWACWAFKLKPEINLLSRLGTLIAPLLFVYLGFKLTDMVIRQTFVYLTEINIYSIMFVLELLIGILIPLRLFLSKYVLHSPLWLFIASSMVVVGTAMNRINVFLIAYKPPFQEKAYYPAIGELVTALTFVCIIILLYRAAVMIFPVISLKPKFVSHSDSTTDGGGK